MTHALAANITVGPAEAVSSKVIADGDGLVNRDEAGQTSS